MNDEYLSTKHVALMNFCCFYMCFLFETCFSFQISSFEALTQSMNPNASFSDFKNNGFRFYTLLVPSSNILRVE